MFGREKPDLLHTIRQDTIDEIDEAIRQKRPARFHGGCHMCFWQHFNTTLEGIRFCNGCKFFEWDQDLPDKSRQAAISR